MRIEGDSDVRNLIRKDITNLNQTRVPQLSGVALNELTEARSAEVSHDINIFEGIIIGG